MNPEKQTAPTINNFGIFSLILSKGITNLPTLVVSLLLVDIATSFNVQVGVAGQIRTTSGLLSIVFALLMGVLSVKYSHKSLLTGGLILYIISAAASYLSTTLTMLMALYALSGVAMSMVNPMINTLIGSLVPPGRRATVIGYTIAGLAFIYLIGSLSASYISPWGWRTALVLVVVPITMLTLILFTSQVREKQTSSGSVVSINSMLKGYGTFCRSKSAVGCILGTVLTMTTWNLYLIYGASYWRQVFLVPTSTTAMSMIFTSLSYIGGSLLVGRFTKIFGVRKLLLASTGVLGGVTFLVFNAPSFPVSMILSVIASFFAGLFLTISSSFSLEQIPEYRGTVMSLHTAAVSMGATLSSALGGLLLITYGYGSYSIIMGFFGLAGALVFMLLTAEQNRKEN